MKNRKFWIVLVLALVVILSMSTFVACNDKEGDKPGPVVDDGPGADVVVPGVDVDYEGLTIADANLKTATYNTYTGVMPSNWNELTYKDNNDTQILSYISSSFFDYDFDFGDVANKYNADGTINAEAIVSGSFATTYSAATKLEDVTASVPARYGYTAEQIAEGGYAWKITLRDDLKWDDGTKIDASDFVYSMQAQLDPDFMNYRANTYYQTLQVLNARDYFYKKTAVVYNEIGDMGYKSNAEAVAANANIHIDVWTFYGAEGYVDAQGNACPQWLRYDDTTVYNSVKGWKLTENDEEYDAFSAKEIWDFYFTPGTGYYADYVEVGEDYAFWLSIPVVNEHMDVEWSDVGMYKVEGENAFVICLGKSYAFLKEDLTLSYLSAYYMSSLPLVKRDLYESCKIAPEEGSTLWTSNYNSSLATTASWGPYKLVEFQSGKSYKLVKNDNWYGYNMNLYKNQYNVTAISCEKISESQTAWMAFLAGTVDDGSLSSDNIADYRKSKYVTWVPESGTYGMQVYGNKTKLAASDNNNAILAIDEFRQAWSLAISRTDVVEKVWPGSSIACYGVMNSMYYYDVLNGLKYRDSDEAKAGLLRAYGYTQDADGLWSLSSDERLSNMELEEAYSTLTGYDLTLAKQKLEAAYQILTSDPSYNYDPSKKITFVFGSSVDNAKQHERMAYLQGVLDTLCAGTSLAGKIELVFDASAGAKWADAFRSGATQISFGAGFSGNAFNPFDIIGGFVDPDDSLNYHTYWDTSKEMLTLTLPAGDYEAAGQTITMSLRNWFFCLNGYAADYDVAYKYNWDAGKCPAEVRLTILAALEEQVLKKSYSIMLIAGYSGSLMSAKFSYVTDEYNTFNGFGGIRYIKVNYTDTEWAQYVSDHGNDLSSEYLKTE